MLAAEWVKFIWDHSGTPVLSSYQMHLVCILSAVAFKFILHKMQLQWKAFQCAAWAQGWGIRWVSLTMRMRLWEYGGCPTDGGKKKERRWVNQYRAGKEQREETRRDMSDDTDALQCTRLSLRVSCSFFLFSNKIQSVLKNRCLSFCFISATLTDIGFERTLQLNNKDMVET